MTDLRFQRRLAADLLGCGVERVWIDPNRISEVEEAVTRSDVRVLINLGAIKKKQVRGISSARRKKYLEQKKKGRRSGPGSRKGTKYARYPRKRRWIDTIRPIRRTLRVLRDEGYIDRSTYRKFYRRASGGMFRNVNHLLLHMKMEGVIDDEAIKAIQKR
jgi:large subunit ribosomal protein L19e